VYKKPNFPMMIGFVRDEMLFKTTLVECSPMVISNVLVSCITGPKRKALVINNFPYINMVILTRGSLSYLINFLLMKLVDAIERRNVSIFIVVDL
jgi:hypothetical protein